VFACGISCAGGSSWLDRPGEGPEDSDCTVRGKNLSKLITSCYLQPEWKDRREKITREATQNVKQQKSLGLYGDYACQTLGSTTQKPGRMVRLFRVGLDQQTGQEADKTQKNRKKTKKKPLFLFLTRLMKCPPNYTNQIIIKPQCGFF
jgi:hypothetical protein